MFTSTIAPPDMFMKFVGSVEVNPNEGEVAGVPAMAMFTVPPVCVYVTGLAEVRRPATFITPPSTTKAAPAPAPITLVATVPMLKIPAPRRSRPLLVGLPF